MAITHTNMRVIFNILIISWVLAPEVYANNETPDDGSDLSVFESVNLLDGTEHLSEDGTESVIDLWDDDFNIERDWFWQDIGNGSNSVEEVEDFIRLNYPKNAPDLNSDIDLINETLESFRREFLSDKNREFVLKLAGKDACFCRSSGAAFFLLEAIKKSNSQNIQVKGNIYVYLKDRAGKTDWFYHTAPTFTIRDRVFVYESLDGVIPLKRWQQMYRPHDHDSAAVFRFESLEKRTGSKARERSSYTLKSDEVEKEIKQHPSDNKKTLADPRYRAKVKADINYLYARVYALRNDLPPPKSNDLGKIAFYNYKMAIQDSEPLARLQEFFDCILCLNFCT